MEFIEIMEFNISSSNSNNMSQNSTMGLLIIDTDSNYLNGLTTNPEIISIVLLSVSLVLDIPSLIIIVLSKPKLIPVEFLIITLSNLFISILKLISLISQLQIRFKFSSNGIVSCHIFYVFNVDFLIFYCVMLFYYALFHLAMVARGSCFKKLLATVHSIKCFLSFCALSFFGFTTFLLTYSFVNRSLMFETSLDQNECNQRFRFEVLAPFLLLNITFVTLFIYLLATAHILAARSSNKMKLMLKNAGLKNQKKKLIVLFKFFLFSIFTCILSVSQNVHILVVYLVADENYAFIGSISSFLFDVVIFLHPIFFILIHNILRNRLSYLLFLGIKKMRNYSKKVLIIEYSA